MKDEIKEILDKLKNLCYDDYCLGVSVDYIERKEEKLLLDYITNLQEKVDQYENPDDLTLFYMWLDEKAKDKMKQLQEDLEKVSGSHFKLFQENKRLQDRNIEFVLERDRLKEKYERMKENAEILSNGYNELEQKIEKAIEYIKEHYVIDGPIKYKNDLLDILQGDAKDA